MNATNVLIWLSEDIVWVTEIMFNQIRYYSLTSIGESEKISKEGFVSVENHDKSVKIAGIQPGVYPRSATLAQF
jgi:hypothetical protein